MEVGYPRQEPESNRYLRNALGYLERALGMGAPVEGAILIVEGVLDDTLEMEVTGG